MIEIKALSLTKYKKSHKYELLKDISFSVPQKRTTLLLGKSGSGKTSILRCISQLEKCYQGEVLFNGKPVDQLSHKERCQAIGFVSQSYALFPFMTVLENCAHPLQVVLKMGKKEAFIKAEKLLFSLEMHHLKNFYPHELSGGQQQRTAILRALALNPQFILLDEPTSALDPENTDLLLQIIHRLKADGKGIIISSQDMNFASKVYDSVYFLEGGKVVEVHDPGLSNRTVAKESKLGRFLFPSESPQLAQI